MGGFSISVVFPLCWKSVVVMDIVVNYCTGMISITFRREWIYNIGGLQVEVCQIGRQSQWPGAWFGHRCFAVDEMGVEVRVVVFQQENSSTDEDLLIACAIDIFMCFGITRRYLRRVPPEVERDCEVGDR